MLQLTLIKAPGFIVAAVVTFHMSRGLCWVAVCVNVTSNECQQVCVCVSVSYLDTICIHLESVHMAAKLGPRLWTRLLYMYT